MDLTKLQPNIQRNFIKDDLIAGLTFAVVNIPQAMANALLAGVNPVLGLNTLMVATPVGALFTSSVFMNVSTTSALSVAAGDALLNVPAEAKTHNLVVLVLLVGLFQVLAGIFRFGRLVRFVSNGVMVGFISGVAVLIILGQLGDFFGYDSIFSNKILQLADLLLNLRQIEWQTTLIGGLTVALIFLLNQTKLSRVSMIAALLVSTLVARLLHFDIAYVGDIATIPDNLVDLAMPDVRLVPGLVTSAIAIGIIGLVQSAGVSQSYPNPDGKYPQASRDFLGQGLANLVTSFFQGIPAGGSMSGTAVTVGAGAKTRLANVFAGLLVIPLLFFFGRLVDIIPMPALAGLLIVVGYLSIKPKDILTVWQTSLVSRTAMTLTFIATLVLPLQFAVFIGVAVSIMAYVVQSSGKVQILRVLPVEGGFPFEEPIPEKLPDHEITILNVYGELFFAAATYFEQTMPDLNQSQGAVVILRLRGRQDIGSTLISVLERASHTLQKNGGQLILAGVSDRVYEQLRRTGELQRIGPGYVFLAEPQLGQATNKAVAAARQFLAERAEMAAAVQEPDDDQAAENAAP